MTVGAATAQIPQYYEDQLAALTATAHHLQAMKLLSLIGTIGTAGIESEGIDQAIFELSRLASFAAQGLTITDQQITAAGRFVGAWSLSKMGIKLR